MIMISAGYSLATYGAGPFILLSAFGLLAGIFLFFWGVRGIPNTVPAAPSGDTSVPERGPVWRRVPPGKLSLSRA